MNNTLISERLMALYGGCGYTRYRVSKFEEYDLYSRNREFLPSRQILTFTDTDGRLMALKPDVTLSIVKNSRDGADARLYYSESVFRTDRGRGVFAEIPQIGLEYMGRPDPYRVSEVLMLAGMSLDLIGAENVLDVSHLGILSLTAKRLGLDVGGHSALTGYFGSKSAAGALSLCRDGGSADLIRALLGMSTDPDKAFEATQNGSILLYHARKRDYNCLVNLIPRLLEAGFQPVTVSELFGYPPPETGDELYVFDIYKHVGK